MIPLKTITEEIWGRERYNSFAGLGVRLLAYLVDIIAFVPVILLLFVVSWFGQLNIPSEAVLLLFILYRILFHFKTGATIGKKQTDLRVEKFDGRKIAIFQSILREIIPITFLVITIILNQIPSILITRTYKSETGDLISLTRPVSDWHFYLAVFPILLLIIDVLWIFTNRENKTLHDSIAKTYCKRK